jgi:hypothetical protein
MLFEFALPSQFGVTGPQNKCHLSRIQMDWELFCSDESCGLKLMRFYFNW